MNWKITLNKVVSHVHKKKVKQDPWLTHGNEVADYWAGVGAAHIEIPEGDVRIIKQMDATAYLIQERLMEIAAILPGQEVATEGSYQLPEMSELSQWEVFTKQMCHPVLCYPILPVRGPGSSRVDGNAPVPPSPAAAAAAAVRRC